MKPYKDYLDDAIADAEKDLLVLKCLRHGLSYQEVGKLGGLSKSGIVARLKKCLPAEALDFSEVVEHEV